MGEMADFALEEVMDYEESILKYRMGHVSLSDAMDLGIIDHNGAEYNQTQKIITNKCKYCGAKDLYWNQLNNKWRLTNKQKEPHFCDKYKK